MRVMLISTLCLTFLLPTSASAQSSTSVIPYSGSLYSQGRPISQSEPVPMAFALYAGQGVAALVELPDNVAPASGRMWTSWVSDVGDSEVDLNITIPVSVRNGGFFVHLGEDGQSPLPDPVFDTPLYVVTWVINQSGVYRLPPHKLQTVPHAVTAKRADSFEVSSDLIVRGDLRVEGQSLINLSTYVDSEILGIGNCLSCDPGDHVLSCTSERDSNVIPSPSGNPSRCCLTSSASFNPVRVYAICMRGSSN